MTPTEYRLLLYLAERQGHVLTVEEIYESLGDIKTTRMSTSVNWYIWQLRGKIEHDPAHPRFIATEPGLGYRFAANGNHREAKLLFKP
jgi:two-component system KDP operon response regulator KdpE